MEKQKINISYIVIQGLLMLSTLYFILAYCLEWNTPLVQSNFEGLTNSVTCLALSFLPIIIKPLKIKFTRILATYYLVAIILHFLVGRAFNAYHTEYYSFIIHLINSFLMGVIIYGMILRTQKKQGKLFMFLTVTACVVLIGAVWEIVEFLVDKIFDGNMQRTLENVSREPFLGKRAVLDTMLDICMDVLGGMLAGLLANVIKFRKKPIYIYFELKSAKYRHALFGEVRYYEEQNENSVKTGVSTNKKE